MNNKSFRPMQNSNMRGHASIWAELQDGKFVVRHGQDYDVVLQKTTNQSAVTGDNWLYVEYKSGELTVKRPHMRQHADNVPHAVWDEMWRVIEGTCDFYELSQYLYQQTPAA